MKTSEQQKPPPHVFYGDSWERGLDPWHRDAFPDEFKNHAPNQKERRGGWFLIDGCGNEIGYIPDGTEYDEKNYIQMPNGLSIVGSIVINDD